MSEEILTFRHNAGLKTGVAEASAKVRRILRALLRERSSPTYDSLG
jgi:hypothetical protein